MEDPRPPVLLRLRHAVEYSFVSLAAVLLGVLPRPLALRLGAALGRLGWALRIRRRLVLSNLLLAMPRTTEAERLRIAREAACNFGRTVAEFLRFPRGDRQRVLDLVELRGIEPLTALQAQGRSAVLVTAHLGSWALYVTALAAAGLRSSLLVGKQTNPGVDEFILSLPGGAVQFISKAKTSPREIIRAIREGRVMVMVADHYSSEQRLKVPFLGRDAYTLPLPGALVERHDLPLFAMAGRRIDGGRHVVEIRAVEVPRMDDREALRVEVARRCNEELGRAILEHPEQYFWYHHRWKERISIPSRREP